MTNQLSALPLTSYLAPQQIGGDLAGVVPEILPIIFKVSSLA